ncbi:MAG: hypothetical protein DMG70_22895 [Acidobacteria bacterium]|nr:MAG: hypothetical protein DMG70_22895 [Acidobacteriota bacterium]
MGSMEVGTVEQGEATAKLPSPVSVSPLKRLTAADVQNIADVNRELWLLLSLYLLAALLNSMLDSRRMLLGLYTLPTLFSAYVSGRSHARLTALGSVLVVLITYFIPVLFARRGGDLGKLDISREILYKAARLTSDEYQDLQKHVGVQMLRPVGGPLGRILLSSSHPGSPGQVRWHRPPPQAGEEAGILTVADVYDPLTSDRPYRKALSPFEAKEAIVKSAGSDFDPKVVEAFAVCFRQGYVDVPEVLG